MGLNGDNCDVLHLGSENQLCEYSMGAVMLERGACEKVLWF